MGRCQLAQEKRYRQQRTHTVPLLRAVPEEPKGAFPAAKGGGDLQPMLPLHVHATWPRGAPRIRCYKQSSGWAARNRSECTVCSRLRNNGFFSAFLPAEVSPHFKAWSGSSSASSFSPSTGRQQSPDLSIRPSPPSTITHLLTSLSFSAFAFPLWASDEVELINHLQSFFFF